jgi:hypothetical protein
MAKGLGRLQRDFFFFFFFWGGPGGDFYQHLVDWNMVCFPIKANFLLGI